LARTPDGMLGDRPSGGTGASSPSGDREASASPLPAGVVTFVMTDIEGSTRLFRELGERYVELLATHQGLLRAPFVNRGGVEVGTEGDALFFGFADAPHAVAACLEGQRALATHPWPPGVVLRVRIGVHTSEATPVGNDYVDLAVHQVARITYERRCAITRERILPVLQAAHIRPVTAGGQHRIENGLLLRSDIHTLFDRGYLTVASDHRLRVSQSLREDFDNGKYYLSMSGAEIFLPSRMEDRPKADLLDWHRDTVFRG